MNVRKNCSAKVREEVFVRVGALPPVRRHVILRVSLIPAEQRDSFSIISPGHARKKVGRTDSHRPLRQCAGHTAPEFPS
jgi:hypothetical protein